MRIGVGDVDGESALALEPGLVFPRCVCWDFGEVLVLGEGEDAAHVSECCEGGDEVDEAVAAIFVEGADVVGGEG